MLEITTVNRRTNYCQESRVIIMTEHVAGNNTEPVCSKQDEQQKTQDTHYLCGTLETTSIYRLQASSNNTRNFRLIKNWRRAVSIIPPTPDTATYTIVQSNWPHQKQHWNTAAQFCCGNHNPEQLRASKIQSKAYHKFPLVPSDAQTEALVELKQEQRTQDCIRSFNPIRTNEKPRHNFIYYRKFSLWDIFMTIYFNMYNSILHMYHHYEKYRTQRVNWQHTKYLR